MNKKKGPGDLSDRIQVAMDRAVRKLIEETKLRGGYLVRGGKDGKPIRVYAKDL